MPPFKIVSDFQPTGDQPQAVEGLESSYKHQKSERSGIVEEMDTGE